MNGGRNNKKLWPFEIFRAVSIGIIVAGVLYAIVPAAWVINCLVAVLVILLALNVRFSWLGFFALGLALVMARYTFIPTAPYGFLGQQNFDAKVVQAPQIKNNKVQYLVQLVPQGYNVQIIAKLYPLYSYGDLLRINCSEVEAITFSSFNNKDIFRRCTYPELSLVQPAPTSLKSLLFSIRSRAGQHLGRLMSEPYAALTTGMLWGEDASLPKEVVDAFRKAGTSHLLAVSGYNVMLLSEILFWLLISVGLWRKQASWVVIAALSLFMIFTGAEAAVLRAGIMGILLITAKLTQRKADTLNIFLGTGAFMLAFDPRLISDLGFQLSFVALGGLLWVGPWLSDRFKFVPEALGLRQSIAQTLAATATTVPIILFRLDQLSLVTIAANIMVAPVVGWIYWLALPLLILGFGPYLLAWPLVWALSALLAYMVAVTNFWAGLPWAVVLVSGMWWFALAAVYGMFIWWFMPAAFKQRVTNFFKSHES